MEKAIRKIVEYLIVILVILNCNSMYISTDKNYHFPDILCVFCIIYLLLNKKISVTTLKRMNKILIVYVPLLFIYMFVSVSGSTVMGFILRFFVYIPIIMYIFLPDKNNNTNYAILYKYVDIMVILCMISIVFWLAGTQLHLISPNMSVISNWGRPHLSNGYFGLYFEERENFLYGYRNAGLFTEGPMFSLNIVIALALHLFIRSDQMKKWKKQTYTIVLISTLISTFTTTGFIVLTLLVVLWTSNSSVFKRMNIILRAIILLSLCTIGLYIAFGFFSVKMASTSWDLRVKSLSSGFMGFIRSPFFGGGYANSEYMANVSMSLYGINSGISNSLATVLSEGGLVLGSIYTIPMLYNIFSNIRSSRKNFAFFTIVVMVEFIFTTFQNTFLMMTLLAFFYSTIITNPKKMKWRKVQISEG